MIDSLGRNYSWLKPPGRKPKYGEKMSTTLALRVSASHQHALRRLALSEHLPVAEVIRNAIDAYLADGGDPPMR